MFNKVNDVEKLHEATLQVLEEIGMEYQNENVLGILKNAGIKVEGKRAYFTREQLNKYVNMSPSEFIIEGRDPKYNLTINRDMHTYSCGYGCSKIREHDGKVRDAHLEDHLKFIELAHQFKHYGFNGGILAHPNDVNQDLSYQIMNLANMYKSDKPVILMPAHHDIFKQMLDMGCIIFAGEENFKRTSKTMTWINPLSPLSVSAEALEAILLCCEYNQTIAITAGGLAGGVTPVSTAGTVVVNNAETLALIALIQIIKPGHSVIHGLSPIVYDMKVNSASVGTPQYTKMSSYGTDLSEYYNIPSRTCGAQSDANGVTAQAGYESMMNIMSARLTNANIILQSGGILDAYATISFEKLIVDFEVISAVEFYFTDPVVDDKTIGIDAIKDVIKNGKNFLSSKHTVKFCRKEPWQSTIAQIGKLKLNDTPDNLFKQGIDDQISKILSEYKTPDINEEIKTKLINFALEIGIEREVVNKIFNQ